MKLEGGRDLSPHLEGGKGVQEGEVLLSSVVGNELQNARKRRFGRTVIPFL